MNFKKFGKALLFPHIAVMLLLIPAATALLVFSMAVVGTDTPLAYLSYTIAAYTLTVWCFQIPRLVQAIKRFRRENKFFRRWQSDARLRVNVSLYSALAGNALYGVFHLWLGFYHKTFWFYSLGAYYVCLGVMRFFLLSHTRKYEAGEREYEELLKYRACGWVFLLMNLALALIVFFMVYFNRTFVHHMITAIAMAAYTFAAFAAAAVNIVRFRKYNSPVFSASKAIAFAAACVSILTLTSTMFTAFGDGTMDVAAQKMMLGSVGFAVSGVVLGMAVYMIAESTKKIKKFKAEEQNATR